MTRHRLARRLMPPAYDPTEQEVVLETFGAMLWAATKDGGKKRAAGIKPPWWRDQAHEAAIFSHLNKWKHGETRDPDSGSHPLVHLAWRALAIAYQEIYGRVDAAGPIALALTREGQRRGRNRGALSTRGRRTG